MPERGFKVRRHLEGRKYFHICFPQTCFAGLVKVVTFFLVLGSKAKECILK